MKTKKKDKQKAKKAKIAYEYKGMRNLPKKWRVAVDALEKLLRELDRNVPNVEIKIYGSHCRGDDGEENISHIFTIFEVSFFIPKPGSPGSGSGSSFMLCDADSRGVLAACADFLETYFTKPTKNKRGEVDDDPHGDAVYRLTKIWNTPNATFQTEVIAYLIWLSDEKPDIKLTEALQSRMHGFYDKKLIDELRVNVMARLPLDSKVDLKGQFRKGTEIIPSRLYEICFSTAEDRLKWVMCSPEAMAAWLKKHPELLQHLEEPPRDVCAGNDDDDRLRYGFADGVDLLITLETSGQLRFTEPTFHKPYDYDPAQDWIQDALPL